MLIIKKFKYGAELEAIASPPFDWQQVKAFKTKNKIDVSLAFNDETLRIIEKAFHDIRRPLFYFVIYMRHI